MKITDSVVRKKYDTVRSIEYTIATFTAIGGLYIFTPLYQVSNTINGPTAFAQALSHPIMVFIFGAVLLIGAILVFVGLKTRRPEIKSLGWFAIIMARLFQLLTTFIVVGALPITWIYPMTVAAVAVILWAAARSQTHNVST